MACYPNQLCDACIVVSRPVSSREIFRTQSHPKGTTVLRCVSVVILSIVRIYQFRALSLSLNNIRKTHNLILHVKQQIEF